MPLPLCVCCDLGGHTLFLVFGWGGQRSAGISEVDGFTRVAMRCKRGGCSASNATANARRSLLNYAVCQTPHLSPYHAVLRSDSRAAAGASVAGFRSECFILFARIHTLSSLQRNLDASTLNKDEMISLLEKSDAITSSSDVPSDERQQASEANASSAAAPADPNDGLGVASSAAALPVEVVDPTSGELVRTLFVGNCPPSMSERELYQVFNRFVGYESSYLYHNNGKVSAFVTFSTADTASYAVQFCTQHGGFPLDPFCILVLQVQLANQNSNRKRKPDQYYPAEVGYAYSSARAASSAQDGYGYGSGSSSYGGYGVASSSSSSSSYENYAQIADLSASAYSSGKSSSRMPPSATLFISYVTDETTVEDLRAVFGQMAGFRAARKTTMRGAPCAFIEFDNDRNSTVAMNIMQGQCLRPTDRGGLRIEYAKPTLNPTKTAATVPLPVNSGAYAGSYGGGSSGRW